MTQVIEQKKTTNGSGPKKTLSKLMTVETLRLRKDQIVYDEVWNSRRAKGKDRPDTEGEGATDEDLEADFRSRIDDGLDPIVQPVRCRGPLLEDMPGKPGSKGKYFLVFGYRRRRVVFEPSKPYSVEQLDIRAEVKSCTGDPRADDKSDQEDNMVENAQRQGLLPWEQAEQWVRYLDLFPEENGTRLAKTIGLSKPHVTNMVRLKRRLCEELWDEFKKKGGSMKVRHLIKVCALPHARQVEEYEALRAAEAGGRPVKTTVEAGEEGGGSSPKQGSVGKTPTDDGESWDIDPKVIERWLLEAEAAVTKDAGEFAEGAAYTLRCILDLDKWSARKLLQPDEESGD